MHCFGIVIWKTDLIIPRTLSYPLLRLWHCHCNNTVFCYEMKTNFLFNQKYKYEVKIILKLTL